MKETNEKKISLSVFFLILAIITIIIMGIYIFKLNNDKTAEIKKSAELKDQIKSLNTTISQEKTSTNTVYSNTTHETKASGTNETSNNTNLDSNYSKEYKRIIEKIESENPNVNLTCDLIYFNNDTIPDLVIDNSGYWVSLYIYENGNICNPINMWAYGAGGNHGYEYVEKKGLIRNYNSDFAGAIITESIFVLNSEKEFDVLSNTKRGATNEDDDITAINEALASYGGYYYNDNKITEQEYNNKLKELSIDINENTFKGINGSKSTQEIKEQL